MINFRSVQIYHPPWMGGRKLELIRRMADMTGRPLVNSAAALVELPAEVLPMICCTPEIMAQVAHWRATGRKFIYWDRGYLRRLGGLFTPHPPHMQGYFRVNIGTFQMQEIKPVGADRWEALRVPVTPWRKGGRKVLVATTESSYWTMHGIDGWLDKTLVALRECTDRPVVVRHKSSRTPFVADLSDAHCLVAHGSNAAVEAVVLGCPVIVDKSSAASLVGRTELSDVENVIYPDREPWLRSLAYSQFTEDEMISGKLWGML